MVSVARGELGLEIWLQNAISFPMTGGVVE
jgi:hypothetical protein